MVRPTAKPDSRGNQLMSDPLPENLDRAENLDQPCGPLTAAGQDQQQTASWVVSLIFWITLCGAAMMYAAVALAPKAAEWIEARNQYVTNARQLVQLEEEVEYLERVAAALKADPEFAERLAQASAAGSAQDQEIVPVTEDLLFGGYQESRQTTKPDPPGPWMTLVYLLASSSSHRTALLFTAIVLTVLGFTFLNDSESGYLHSIGRFVVTVVMFPVRRYQKSGPVTPSSGVESESQETDAAVLDQAAVEAQSLDGASELSELDPKYSQLKINAPSARADPGRD